MNVLLIHGEPVMHYRVKLYNCFAERFEHDGVCFTVASNIIDSDSNELFDYIKVANTFSGWVSAVKKVNPDIVILFSGIRNIHMMFFLYYLNCVGIKKVYWGHGVNLRNKKSFRWLYSYLHYVVDAIIIYSAQQKSDVLSKYHSKLFVAPNTLCLEGYNFEICENEKYEILKKNKIQSKRNIVFVGRIQERKGVIDLLRLKAVLNDPSVGIVLIGPDKDNILPEKLPNDVYHLNEMYGQELYDLMMSCDICCCPGWVGLNIVDAMACGLPFITTDVDHAPEIMYLKDGYNGRLVEANNVKVLADVVYELLNDESSLKSMGIAARNTFLHYASVDAMYGGFMRAFKYLD